MKRSTVQNGYIRQLTNSARKIQPNLRVVSSCPTEPEVVANGRNVLLMCSPNYLSLANETSVVNAFLNATGEYGAGTVGSGFISGYTAAHQRVEQDLARFMNEEAAVFYNSVSDVSAGVIAAVLNPPLLPVLDGISPGDLGSCAAFVDCQVHASLLDAVRLAKPEKTNVYRHCDVGHLRQLLARSTQPRKLVVTDGYFSMSARIAPLREIAQVCEEYDAMLLVDDAHGTGVFGDNGRGTPEMLGVEDRVDFCIGSTAKGFGVRGGYIAGPRDFIEYTRLSSRRYMFSGTLPAGVPAAVSQALRTAEQQPWRRAKLAANAASLRRGLEELGCDVRGQGHIVPWFIGDDSKVDYISEVLEEARVFASAIRFPAVARGEAIIRFMLMAAHTEQHIGRTLAACEKALVALRRVRAA